MDLHAPNATDHAHHAIIHGACCHWSLPQSILLTAVATFVTVLLGAACRPSRFPSVKGPKPVFLFGHVFDFVAKGPLKCLVSWWSEYGDVFKFQIGFKETLVIADAEMIKEVSVKKFKSFRNRPTPAELPTKVEKGIVLGRDKYWATARGACIAWFHNKEHLQSYLELMNKRVDKLVDDLKALSPGDVVDIHEKLQALTVDIFCSAAFGETLQESVDSDAYEVAKSVAATTQSLNIPTVSMVASLFVPPLLAKTFTALLGQIPGMQERKNLLSAQMREAVGRKVLEKRQRELQAGGQRQDMLTQLLRAQAKAAKEQVKLSDTELMFVLAELIAAGSDTTSNTVAFAIFLLSAFPKKEARLAEEVKALSPHCPTDFLVNLEKYKYTGMVVKEVLRLFPTGAQLFREAQEDTVVGGVPVHKGAQIMFPLWLLHRNPRHFPNPDAFIPERFDPNDPASEGSNMNAYLPFGDGPRMCLGSKFALQEAVLALVKLYSNFKFKLGGELEGLEGEAAMAAFPVETAIIIKPTKGLDVHVEARN